MRWGPVVPACLLVCAARLAVAGEGEAESRDVELRLVRAEAPGPGLGFAQVRLDAEGRGSIPFANAAGKLLVGFAGGRVLVDADGDGAIDAADGEGVRPPGQGPLGQSSPTLEVRVKIAGRDERYPLAVLFAQPRAVVLGSGAHLEGKLGGSTVRLFDADVNGSFGDVGRDGILVSEAGPGEAGELLAREPAPLGRVIAIAGELYDGEVAGGGASLRLAPFSGEKATLALKPKEAVASAAVQLAHVDGLFACRADSAAKACLPAGKYRIMQVQLSLEDPEEGKPPGSLAERLLGAGPPGAGSPVLLGSGDAEAAPIEILPGENELSPGPPFALDFAASVARDRGTLQVTDAAIVGGAGERYRAQLFGAGCGSSLTVNVRAGGKERRLAKLEYG